jgi:hypothetical protein
MLLTVLGPVWRSSEEMTNLLKSKIQQSKEKIRKVNNCFKDSIKKKDEEIIYPLDDNK